MGKLHILQAILAAVYFLGNPVTWREQILPECACETWLLGGMKMPHPLVPAAQFLAAGSPDSGFQNGLKPLMLDSKENRRGGGGQGDLEEKSRQSFLLDCCLD